MWKVESAEAYGKDFLFTRNGVYNACNIQFDNYGHLPVTVESFLIDSEGVKDSDLCFLEQRNVWRYLIHGDRLKNPPALKLLALSRIECGKIFKKFNSTNINYICIEKVSLLRHLFCTLMVTFLVRKSRLTPV